MTKNNRIKKNGHLRWTKGTCILPYDKEQQIKEEWSSKVDQGYMLWKDGIMLM